MAGQTGGARLSRRRLLLEPALPGPNRTGVGRQIAAGEDGGVQIQGYFPGIGMVPLGDANLTITQRFKAIVIADGWQNN